MVTIHRERGFSVVLYPGDREHTPPHVHVFPGDEEVKIAVGDEETAPWIWEVLGMRKRGWRARYGLSKRTRTSSWPTGEGIMARKWTPASDNPEEFERQFAAGVKAGRLASETEPRAEGASYDAELRRMVVELRGGLTVAFPAAHYPQLASLGTEGLGQVRATPSGHGLHWDDVDVHLAVPQIIQDLFGAYSAHQTGRKGGKSRSAAKGEAARKNALRGGRPATRTTTTRRNGMMRVTARAGVRSRSVDVCVGGQYVVEPMNPAARRNRGRTGQVVEFGDVRDSRVRFRFNDTGRVVLVEPSDLLPLEHETPAA